MVFPVNSTLLDACVLGIVNKSDTYGYKITQELTATVEVSESTLYPVLRRLQKNGFLTTYDEPFNGRNRRYYQITESGKNAHKDNLTHWQEYKEKIDFVLKGEGNND